MEKVSNKCRESNSAESHRPILPRARQKGRQARGYQLAAFPFQQERWGVVSPLHYGFELGAGRQISIRPSGQHCKSHRIDRAFPPLREAVGIR